MTHERFLEVRHWLRPLASKLDSSLILGGSNWIFLSSHKRNWWIGQIWVKSAQRIAAPISEPASRKERINHAAAGRSWPHFKLFVFRMNRARLKWLNWTSLVELVARQRPVHWYCSPHPSLDYWQPLVLAANNLSRHSKLLTFQAVLFSLLSPSSCQTKGTAILLDLCCKNAQKRVLRNTKSCSSIRFQLVEFNVWGFAWNWPVCNCLSPLPHKQWTHK